MVSTPSSSPSGAAGAAAAAERGEARRRGPRRRRRGGAGGGLRGRGKEAKAVEANEETDSVLAAIAAARLQGLGWGFGVSDSGEGKR